VHKSGQNHKKKLTIGPDSPIFYQSTGPVHSKYVRHVGVGGCREILCQGRKTQNWSKLNY
jgi:hypothetical protein